MARLFEKLRWLRRHASSFVIAALMLFSGNGNVRAADTSTNPPTKWYLLPEEEARKGQPVRIQGTVLCYDPGWGQFYINDDSDTIAVYVNPRCFTNRFEVGQFIAVKAKTTWDETGCTLTNSTASIFGIGPLPQPHPARLSDLAQSYAQWIEVRGQVRVAEASRERVTLVLKDGEDECLVYVMQTFGATEFKNLIDCWVKVQGINASRIENGHLDAAILFSPGMEQVKVISPSQEDRWHLPVATVGTLLTRPAGDWTNEPVHVNGLISAYKPGSSITITDPTGVMKAEVIQVTPAQAYQQVDVWGFLTIRNNQVCLADAYFEIDTESGGKDISVAAAKRNKMNEEVLTNITQIRSLSKERANENLPARVRGVLTCVDLEWRVVFLQDGHNAIFLETGQSDLQTGQWVEVTGETDGRGFAPGLINCSTRILGTTNMPAAAKVDLLDVASGQLDSQWVEIDGVVRRVSKENGRIALTLAGPNGKFTAVVRDFNTQPAPTELIDSFISVRGACGSSVNSRGQITGITLHVPSRKEITVIDPSPIDPFAIVPTPIANVATFNTQRLPGRRIKVSGVVTLIAPDRTLFLQDASGGMRIYGGQSGQIRTGEQVEAIGFPAFSEFSPRLDEAIVRDVEAGTLPEAKKVSAAEILQGGKFDGSMVELEGKLLQNLSASQPKLVLQDGPVLFTAQIALPGFHESMPSLSAGSQIRVRGVCIIQGGENNEPASFQVLLSDTHGISLIKAAPWWTLRHTMMLIGGTVLGLILASVWMQSLRRQVRLQTEVIRSNHEKLLEISRQAGMAEVATSVLHNVGNVLNSINVSASLVDEHVRKSRIADVRRLADLLEEHAKDRVAFLTSDPKGQAVPDYLCRLASKLDAERAAMLDETLSLRKNVEHVKEIISMQQSYARVSGMLENVEVAELLEDTMRMNAGSFTRNNVKVVRDIGVMPPICTDKHKVLQILVNLVRNAKFACDESGRSDKQVTLRATNGDGRVKISVIDNGVGIPPENLTRIFNHGFTTRKDGHGFGLHSGALAAKELGGSLTVYSRGAGFGAVFTLELPNRPPATKKNKVSDQPQDSAAAA
jgi:signal transduction histidine kinase